MPKPSTKKRKIIVHIATSADGYIARPDGDIEWLTRRPPPKGDEVRIGTEGMLRFSGAVERDPAIDVWLNERAPERGAIARTWFVRMRECGNDVRELMHDGYPTACVADAPFCYVGVFTAHVNVGFFHGAALADPTGLLQGSGKRMRHVKVKPGADLNAAALSALIDAAYADIKSRLEAE